MRFVLAVREFDHAVGDLADVVIGPFDSDAEANMAALNLARAGSIDGSQVDIVPMWTVAEWLAQ